MLQETGLYDIRNSNYSQLTARYRINSVEKRAQKTQLKAII